MSDGPRINFIADLDVHDWWQGLPPGQRSRRLNELIRRQLEAGDEESLADRVKKLEKKTDEIIQVLKTIKSL